MTGDKVFGWMVRVEHVNGQYSDLEVEEVLEAVSQYQNAIRDCIILNSINLKGIKLLMHEVPGDVAYVMAEYPEKD